MAANIAPTTPIGILLLSHHPRKSISMPRTHAGRSRASALTIASSKKPLAILCDIHFTFGFAHAHDTKHQLLSYSVAPSLDPTQRHGQCQCRRMNKNEALCAALLSARYATPHANAIPARPLINPIRHSASSIFNDTMGKCGDASTRSTLSPQRDISRHQPIVVTPGIGACPRRSFIIPRPSRATRPGGDK